MVWDNNIASRGERQAVQRGENVGERGGNLGHRCQKSRGRSWKYWEAKQQETYVSVTKLLQSFGG